MRRMWFRDRVWWAFELPLGAALWWKLFATEGLTDMQFLAGIFCATVGVNVWASIARPLFKEQK